MPVFAAASTSIVSGAVLSVYLLEQLPALVLSVEQLVPVFAAAGISIVKGGSLYLYLPALVLSVGQYCQCTCISSCLHKYCQWGSLYLYSQLPALVLLVFPEAQV